ncbi:peptidase S28 family protein [Tieghemostelium lacteum]|uniref:Peptidase S28 family protein n=1 Tax=Tieghemostelium lacteum TaxID=361077 RepID=A0A151ZH43_TIELA|nr:peptidase S28 family protein [Tieghemostelium lacteum]|eukprot:KYQ93237.1 peptidase S28 family protein [Tieghemostelium lacteum]
MVKLIQLLVIVTLLVFIINITSASSGKFKKWHSEGVAMENNKKSRKEFLSTFPDYTPPPPAPEYQTYYYTQTIDHFNFQTQGTFQQRYLVSDIYWNKPGPNDKVCNGPILFYTGNEGDITLFYENSQFVTNVLAEELGALLIFAEHRYYGASLPFGDNSLLPEYIGMLTSEQALADYAELILNVLPTYNASHCPVLAVGGSYGGMLAGWFRIKYPNVVDGALAASAPVSYFLGTGVNDEGFNKVATNDYTQTSSEGSCSERIQSAFNQITQTSQQQGGLAQLAQQFRICGPLTNFDDLINWIEAGLTYMAMADYTSPANFLEPLPANPINVSCSAMAELSDDVEGLVAVLNVYFNSTANVQCFNTSIYMTSAVSSNAWDYQACTEMIMPVTSDNVHDMFPVSTFDLETLTEYCQATWQTTPNPYWITTYFGGGNFSATNIIWSNGERDPWSAGGVLNADESTQVSFLIHSGAHHADLRYPEPDDSISLQETREIETKYFQIWSNEAAIRKQLK